MAETQKLGREETADVIFGVSEVGDGLAIAHILLNRPAQLNAMNTAMIAAINRQLDSWEHDERIVALGIAGAGDRAFCAGGDVVALRQMLVDSREHEVDSYFGQEYLLDTRLHQWSKPVIILTHGVCMGGGLGLMMTGSHRVVSPNMALAMPEAHIGFYPDVGACGFLSKLPDGVGRTLALTGMTISSHDAYWLGLATAYVSDVGRATFWDRLAKLPWNSNEAHNHSIVNEFLMALSAEALSAEAIGDAGASQVGRHTEHFGQLSDEPGVEGFSDRLASLASEVDYFQPVVTGLKGASPTSLVLTDSYYELCRGRGVIEVIANDMILASRAVRQPDFAEGVRSRLVTKGAAPCWQYDTVAEVDPSLIEGLLAGIVTGR